MNILRELDQNQLYQKSLIQVNPPPQQEQGAQLQNHPLARKIPKCRVEKYLNLNGQEKENQMLESYIKLQLQGEISQQVANQQKNQSQNIVNYQQMMYNFTSCSNVQMQERATFGQKEASSFQNQNYINKDRQNSFDQNDSVSYAQKSSSFKKNNSFSNEKLDLKSKIEQPYQVFSAEVKSCKFSNRPNSQDWLQFGHQQQCQRYDVKIDSNDKNKIAKNLNFTDSFNISQILKESTSNLQNVPRQQHQQLNQSFHSNSSLNGSRAIITEKPPLNQQFQQQQQQQYLQYQQQQQLYQVPIQSQPQQQQDLTKKRSNSLTQSIISNQNSQQPLRNAPATMNQMSIQHQQQIQFQQQQLMPQKQQQVKQQENNSINQSQSYQQFNIYSHNIHQSQSENQNLNDSNLKLKTSNFCNMNGINSSTQKQQKIKNPNTLQNSQQQIIQKNIQEETFQNKPQNVNSVNNLDQSMMYKSVISQINEDFISKDSMNLLLHEEEFINQFKIKVDQEKNSIRQSYDFIMKHIYDQISIEINKQFSLLDKQIVDFTELFQKFKSHAIEYKNISTSIPPLSSNLKNVWNSCILSNINNYIQEGCNNNSNKLQEYNLYDMINWEECLKAKVQHQQQQHQYQQIYFQQKELLLQTECISQQIYCQLQTNRVPQFKDQSLNIFFNVVDSMKPQQNKNSTNNQSQQNLHNHLLENKKQNIRESKNNSLERNAVINTEFSPERNGFRQLKTQQNTDSQLCSDMQSQKNIYNINNIMNQSEVNSKITKTDVEKWDTNQIFTQVQSRKPSIDEKSLASALKKDFKQFDEGQADSLPFDRLVKMQKQQLQKYGEQNIQENLNEKHNNKIEDNSNKEETERQSLKIIAQDFVERIDSYKAPYMFRDEDQIAAFESSEHIISNCLNENGKSQMDSYNSVQQANAEKSYQNKKYRKNSSRNGKSSSLSNNGSNRNQLFTDREQEFQFDDQQDQFNNTYSIQLSVSRISNQEVDQLNETINNLRLLNESFQNNNLNETLMNLQLLNTQNNCQNSSNSNNNNNNCNNRLSLKQLLAQTNLQLAQQLNMNNQKANNQNPPPPPPKQFNNLKQEGIDGNKKQIQKKQEDDTIFSENELKRLREQLKKDDSLDEFQINENYNKKISDSPAQNTKFFQRKLKNSRVNIISLPSSKTIDENNNDESEVESSQYSTQQNLQQQQLYTEQKMNNQDVAYINLPLSVKKDTNQEMQQNISEQNKKQQNNQKAQSDSQSYIESRKSLEDNSNKNSNNNILNYRTNPHMEMLPPSQQRNAKRNLNEYNSAVDQTRKGYSCDFDSQRSNQSLSAKETQVSSAYVSNFEGQSVMSIMTSKRRFDSLTRNLQSNTLNGQSQPPHPSYNIEFEGYVKQKQNHNDSFQRSSFRMNSLQSSRAEKINSVQSPRNTQSNTEEEIQKSVEFNPISSDGYQFIRRDIKSIDIFKPKTYSLYNGENIWQQELDSKGMQVICCLWVRDNVFAFATTKSSLLIYDTSKANSENPQEQQLSLKKFSSKVPIHKMVRVNEQLIALSSKQSQNIKLFDIEKLDVSLQLIGHNENITDVTFIQPSVLISTSSDGCMIVWQDFVITHKKQNKNEIKFMSATNDLSRLVCIDSANQILIYQLLFNETKSRLCEIRNEKIIKTCSNISSINTQFFSNNMLACGTDEGIIRIYNIDDENVIKIIKVSLSQIQNLLLVEHPTQNYQNINYILIVGSQSDDDLVTFSKISNSNDIISTNSKYRISKEYSSNNYSTFFIQNQNSNNLSLFTLDQSTSQFSLWNMKFS